MKNNDEVNYASVDTVTEKRQKLKKGANLGLLITATVIVAVFTIANAVGSSMFISMLTASRAGEENALGNALGLVFAIIPFWLVILAGGGALSFIISLVCVITSFSFKHNRVWAFALMGTVIINVVFAVIVLAVAGSTGGEETAFILLTQIA